MAEQSLILAISACLRPSRGFFGIRRVYLSPINHFDTEIMPDKKKSIDISLQERRKSYEIDPLLLHFIIRCYGDVRFYLNLFPVAEKYYILGNNYEIEFLDFCTWIVISLKVSTGEEFQKRGKQSWIKSNF